MGPARSRPAKPGCPHRRRLAAAPVAYRLVAVDKTDGNRSIDLPRQLRIGLRDGTHRVASPVWERAAVWSFDVAQQRATAVFGSDADPATTNLIHDLEQGAFVVAGARTAATHTRPVFDASDLIAITAIYNGREYLAAALDTGRTTN